jgi:SM-20-related protein
MAWKILNFEALVKAPVVKEPFPYLIIDNIIRPEVMADVLKTFPQIDKRGSFPLNALTYTGHFDMLLEELQKEELRDLIAEKFGMDLKDKPPMVTLRGHTAEKDGQIHVDSESKLITVLLYLNPNWQDEGGRLRLLYNKNDLTPYAAEVSPEAGRCLIFKVTDNCWHGHAPFVGERRSIQLNYVTSDAARERHLKLHRFTAFLKKLFSKKDEKNPVY